MSLRILAFISVLMMGSMASADLAPCARLGASASCDQLMLTGGEADADSSLNDIDVGKSAQGSDVSSKSKDKNKETENKDAQKEKPLTDDQKVTAAQQAQANACQSQASAAQNTCGQAVSTMNQATSEFQNLSSQMNSMSNANPAGACQQISNVANRSTSSIQSARSSCQSSVGSCQQACSEAVSSLSSLPGSQAYATARSGQSNCSDANSKLSGVDVALGEMQRTAGQARNCVADSTGNGEQQISLTEAAAADGQRRTTDVAAQAGSSSWSSSTPTSTATRRTADIVGNENRSVTTDSTGGNIRLGEDQSKDSKSYQASQRRLMTATGTQAKPFSTSSALGAAGNEKISLGSSRDGQRSLGGSRYSGGGDYSTSGVRRTANMKSDGIESVQQARRGRIAAGTQQVETVDLRRFQPDMKRSPSSSSQLGSPHMNLFRTINKRFDRLSGTFDVLPPGA